MDTKSMRDAKGRFLKGHKIGHRFQKGHKYRFQKGNKAGFKHGFSKNSSTATKEEKAFYHVWDEILERAVYRRSKCSYIYAHVTLCRRWRDFISFKDDLFALYHEARIKAKGQRVLIDRINWLKGYEPGNVRFVTNAESNRNLHFWSSSDFELIEKECGKTAARRSRRFWRKLEQTHNRRKYIVLVEKNR